MTHPHPRDRPDRPRPRRLRHLRRGRAGGQRPAEPCASTKLEGLLTPARSAGGTRRYSGDDLARLREIGRLLDDGLNLAGITAVLELQAANRVLQDQLDKERRRAQPPRRTRSTPRTADVYGDGRCFERRRRATAGVNQKGGRQRPGWSASSDGETVRYLQRSPQCRVVRAVPMADVPLTLGFGHRAPYSSSGIQPHVSISAPPKRRHLVLRRRRRFLRTIRAPSAVPRHRSVSDRASVDVVVVAVLAWP